MIVYNNKSDLTNVYLGNTNIAKVYIGTHQAYPSSTPPTPVFDGKYKLTLSDSSVVTRECDSTSAITYNEVARQYGTTLVSVKIGECVTSIGNSAFYFCGSLASIDIPSSVTSIGSYAFNSCSGITSIDVPSSVKIIGENAFYYCKGLTSCTLDSGVTSISNYAFEGCTSLTSLVIPSSVTSIGYGAFRNVPWWSTYSADTSHQYSNIVYINDVAYKAVNTSITSVTFKDGTKGIGGTALASCTSLTSINIPSSVTSIGARSFYNCSSLTSITVNATTPPALGSAAFDSTNNCPIYVPSGSVDAYKSASGFSTYASRIFSIPT